MKWFMSIFDPIFASTASVRFPQHISAMFYLFKHFSPFLLTPAERKDIQNKTKRYWEFSLYLLIAIKNVDFLTSGIKKK